jgi:hypothetical protein
MWTREDTTTTPSRQEMSADSSKGKLQAAAQIRGHPDTTTTTPSRQEEEKVSAATNNAIKEGRSRATTQRISDTPDTTTTTPSRQEVAADSSREGGAADQRANAPADTTTTPSRQEASAASSCRGGRGMPPPSFQGVSAVTREQPKTRSRQASREYQLLPGNSRKPEAAKLPGSISCYQGTAEIRSRQASRGYQLLPGNS